MDKYTMSKYLDKEALIKSALKDLYQINKIANNVLYFDDNSDYQTALWEILSIINPSLDEDENLDYID